MSWDVYYSSEALRDLQDIYEYIAFVLSAPETAEKLVNKLRAMIRSLDEMPNRYPIYDSEPWRSKGIRKFNVGHYLVFYVPQEEQHSVMIVRIIYGGRDLTNQETE